MKKKLAVLTKFKKFKEKIEKEIDRNIMCLRTDNTGEYISNEFTKFLQDCKIRRQFICLDMSQQNGVAEWKNKHLAKICRNMLHTKNVP